MTLRETRAQYGVSAKEISENINIPLRTYVRYEQKEDVNNLKYIKILELLKEKYSITEDKGVYTLEQLKKLICEVLYEYNENIEFCYIFGSYAKGYATENSDVDICVNTSLSGLKFVGLIEKLREKLNKKVDVIRFNDLKNNFELINEIMKDGIKIYG